MSMQPLGGSSAPSDDGVHESRNPITGCMSSGRLLVLHLSPARTRLRSRSDQYRAADPCSKPTLPTMSVAASGVVGRIRAGVRPYNVSNDGVLAMAAHVAAGGVLALMTSRHCA